MWICTLLGTAAGVTLTWFLSLQSETTFEMWIDELFVQRHICVVSNALILKASFYNFGDIQVVANACAGVTPEKHEAAF